MQDSQGYRLSSAEIIEQIREEHEKGFGFVPFAGSGISSASGILMGQEFTNYLAWVVYRSLRDDSRDARRNRLDIRSEGWPPLPDQEEVREAKTWVGEKYDSICKQWAAKLPNPGILDGSGDALADSVRILYGIQRSMKPEVLTAPDEVSNVAAQEWIKFTRGHVPASGYDLGLDAAATSEGRIIEQGIRSLYDWRATLYFLSSLWVDQPRDSEFRTLRLERPDPGIVDSFNIHITRGRRHNFAHKMIAHLSRSLRTRVLLTTNFDTLLEDSFRAIGHSLTVFQVGYHDSMPDAATVRAQNSLVKLHGGLLSTRADFSLDDEPTNRDFNMFDKYLFPYIGLRPGTGNHLMVMGFSGRDERIIKMIRFVLENHDKFRLFWFCHSDRDAQRIEQLFPTSAHADRISIHVTDRVDLFLYELYQELNGSLPPGGFSFQFTHNVPPESLHPGAPDTEYETQKSQLFEALRDKDLEHVQDCDTIAVENWERYFSELMFRSNHNESVLRNTPPEIQDEFKRRDNKEGLSIVVDGASGLSSLIGDVYTMLNKATRRECIWLELEDNFKPTHVITELLQILALRRGRFQLEHVPLRPLNKSKWCLPTNGPNVSSKPPSCRILDQIDRDKNHLLNILKALRVAPSECYLFLYGRNGPGGCAGLGRYRDAKRVEQTTPEEKLLEGKLDEMFAGSLPAYWSSERLAQDDSKSSTLACDDYTEFFLIRMLLKSLGFVVVYLPYTFRRFKYEESSGDDVAKLLEPYGIKDYSLKRNMRLTLANVDAVAEHALRVWVKRRHPDVPQAKPLCPLDDLLVGNVPAIRSKTFESTIEGILGWLSVDRKINPFHKVTVGSQFSWKKIRFLFACTLFRISRHPSALISEAVFHCPRSYNTEGVDNDEERRTRVTQWIESLRAIGVFHRKPGGYAWKHRDLREAIYCVLKNMKFERKNVSNNDDGYVKLWDREKRTSVTEIESDLHYHIGRWYFKAFCSTGHHLPLQECLYHYFQTLMWLHCRIERKRGDDTEPNEMQLTMQRVRWFASVLNEISGKLQIADKTITYWMQDDKGAGIFDLADDFLLKEKDDSTAGNSRPLLDGFFLKLSNAKWPTGASEDNSRETLEPLNDRLAMQFADIEMRLSATGRDVRTPAFTSRSFVTDHDDRESAIGTNKSKEQVESKSDAKQQLAQTPARNSKVRLNERLDAIKGIVFKDGAATASERKAFDRAFQDWLWPLRRNEKPSRSEKIEWHRNHRDGIVPFVINWCASRWDSREAMYERSGTTVSHLVHLWNDTAYECIKYAKLQDASREPLIRHARYLQLSEDPISRPVPISTNSSWLAVCASCLCAKRAADEFPSALINVQLEQYIRSLTMYGFALGRLRRFGEAHRRLDEALALLSKASLPMAREMHAVVHLRRSEVFIHQAQKHASPFPASFWEKVNDLQRVEDRCLERSRCIQVCYDNAWNELERAASLLSGESRSGLWWGRLYTLQLRVAAETEINKGADEASVFLHGSFHALCERTREDFDTMVEKIYDKAILIAQGDPARICRVISYYATFLIARFHPNRKRSTLYSEQRRRTHQKLQGLAVQLERVRDELGESDGIEEFNGQAELYLRRYVEATVWSLQRNIEQFMTRVPEEMLPKGSALPTLIWLPAGQTTQDEKAHRDWGPYAKGQKVVSVLPAKQASPLGHDVRIRCESLDSPLTTFIQPPDPSSYLTSDGEYERGVSSEDVCAAQVEIRLECETVLDFVESILPRLLEHLPKLKELLALGKKYLKSKPKSHKKLEEKARSQLTEIFMSTGKFTDAEVKRLPIDYIKNWRRFAQSGQNSPTQLVLPVVIKLASHLNADKAIFRPYIVTVERLAPKRRVSGWIKTETLFEQAVRLATTVGS